MSDFGDFEVDIIEDKNPGIMGGAEGSSYNYGMIIGALIIIIVLVYVAYYYYYEPSLTSSSSVSVSKAAAAKPTSTPAKK